jgi:hypothetical protein
MANDWWLLQEPEAVSETIMGFLSGDLIQESSPSVASWFNAGREVFCYQCGATWQPSQQDVMQAQAAYPDEVELPCFWCDAVNVFDCVAITGWKVRLVYGGTVHPDPASFYRPVQ